MSLLLCTIKAHFGILSEYLQNVLQSKKKFFLLDLGYTLKSFKAPRKIVYCPISSLMFVLLCVI